MLVMLEQHSCKRDVPFCDQDASVLNIHARVCEISAPTIISKSPDMYNVYSIWETVIHVGTTADNELRSIGSVRESACANIGISFFVLLRCCISTDPNRNSQQPAITMLKTNRVVIATSNVLKLA